MSRKAIPKKIRQELYDRYNHRCAYCGCEITYSQMQIDHKYCVYHYEYADFDINGIDNLLPACRQCNFYKSTFDVNDFRRRLKDILWNNLRKNNFNYRLCLKYGLITENDKEIKFYYEELEEAERRGNEGV